jgi:ribosomal protein L7/L12
MMEQMEAALKKAKNELSYAIHLEECGGNAGIRKMNANKAEWLKWVVYLAELGLEAEKILAEQDRQQKDAVATDKAYELKSDFQRVMDLFQAVNSIKL